jgi:hypothetical protein
MIAVQAVGSKANYRTISAKRERSCARKTGSYGDRVGGAGEFRAGDVMPDASSATAQGSRSIETRIHRNMSGQSRFRRGAAAAHAQMPTIARAERDDCPRGFWNGF